MALSIQEQVQIGFLPSKISTMIKEFDSDGKYLLDTDLDLLFNLLFQHIHCASFGTYFFFLVLKHAKYVEIENFPTIFSLHSICPRSLGPFHIVTYYRKWVKTSWTYGMFD